MFKGSGFKFRNRWNMIHFFADIRLPTVCRKQKIYSIRHFCTGTDALTFFSLEKIQFLMNEFIRGGYPYASLQHIGPEVGTVPVPVNAIPD
jgi:hypothetical protein